MTNNPVPSSIHGHTRWVIPGGCIPLDSHGPEPDCTSRDELIILNTHDEDAAVALHVYYAERPPVGPYRIRVPARRIRCIRCNDLIDPEALPLDTPYALTLTADRPVFVQFIQRYFGQHQRYAHPLVAYPIGD
ncbi:hypothetical protein SAMN05421747_109142 [Parapedobacter composti]|uniref:Sensory rhodopsin transducer n=1 Tax=Parapedobacter composti TaxID=623281 RepID=A0A1I1ILN3_9SPHI|nr:sensory rhodopsin transducer [Parapedobacter composti]SFC37127.1 hypothetical protein SAMN05421747_109142 [Parapedobacter composti]